MRLGLGLGINRRAGKGSAPIDFRIVVKTDNTGVSSNDQFQFTGALGDYDVEVWDSTGSTLQETITGLSGAATITIAAGTGTYELRVFAADVGGFNRIQFSNAGDKEKLIEVRNWGDVVWSTMNAAFRGCSNLTSITSFVSPNLSNVTNFRLFARGCSSLVTLDVSSWNTSNVTDFGSFVYNCTSLKILDVSSWDTSNVTDFGLFAYLCTSLKILDVSSWDTSNVTDFDLFALGCSSLTDIIGVENFNISSVTNFTNFLSGTTIPTSRYNQLLINYEAQTPNTGLSFHGGFSTFTAGGAAEAAHTSLSTTYSWTIADGGSV